jgi:hypothetical protein
MSFGIEDVPLSSASSSFVYAIPPTSAYHRAMQDLLTGKTPAFKSVVANVT